MLTHGSFEGNPIFQNSPKGLENRVQNTKESLIAIFGISLRNLVELAACVCPAGCEPNMTLGGQLLEPGIAIDMQGAAVADEMRSGPFGLAIRFIEADDRGRLGACPSALITCMHP